MTYQALLKYGLQLVVTSTLWVAATASGITEQNQGKNALAGKQEMAGPNIRYKQPLLDDDSPAIAVRNNRGTEGEAAILQVLAPDHTGLTLQPQPTLYWYASTPVATRFTITATSKKGVNQLLGIDIEKAAGIQQLNLGDHNIYLQPGLSYQWSVNQVVSKNSQSKGVAASAVIERMKPGEGLTHRVERNRNLTLVNIYAIEGIWYDALETISAMIEKSPEDQQLVTIRKSLLDQIGVNIVIEK